MFQGMDYLGDEGPTLVLQIVQWVPDGEGFGHTGV